ncbi:uncharacterized protein LOC111101698 [Crassostrea virginica]|uniref:Uncharacterized protein LOC111101698 n=1 Tax=Crassostrea virginica TaxID=6565 RepID=A0A8B8AFN3_CRAVI|nr:uncharacterized protein LOC111101698 [Crassostrea virginica]
MDCRTILSLGVLAMFLLPGSLSVAIWDRASLVCSTIPGKQVLDEESGRYFLVPQTCEVGEVAWRMTKSYVALRFWRPKPFRVCFSSNTPVNYEKYSVFNASFGNMFVGSPNMYKKVCVNSIGNRLDIVLLSKKSFYVMRAKFTVHCNS